MATPPAYAIEQSLARQKHGPQAWGARMRAELIGLVQFIRRPTRRHPIYVSRLDILWRVAVVLGAHLVFTLVVAAPIQFGLDRLIGLDPAMDTSRIAFMVSAILVAPAMEELVFRGGLRGATMTLAVQPVMVALLVAQWNVALALLCVTSTLMVADRLRQRQLDAAGRFALRMARGRAFLSHYRLVVWGYAVAFGLLHMSSFNVTARNGWLTSLLVFAVLSQMCSGIVLSYLRLRYGLLCAMGFHGIFNLTAVLIDKATT